MIFEIQAHRGARAFYPENTLHAFCKAADLGCCVIELDLVVSRDRRIVVSHDPWMMISDADCVTRRFLYDLDYEEIAQVDCGSPSPAFPDQRSVRAVRPLLAEVFGTVERHLQLIGRPEAMIYNLEVKSWPERDAVAHPEPQEYVGLLFRDIAASGVESRIRLQSFDWRILGAAKRVMPELCYGLLVEEPGALGDFPDHPGFVPDYVNPRVDMVDEALVARLHGLGAKVVAWTVNQPEAMLEMKRLGLDGIITDHPEIALHLPGLVEG